MGEAYIQEFCLLFFDLVIILTAACESEFARQLYRILRSKGKQAIIVRTKADIDVASLPQNEQEAKQLQMKQSMMETFQATDQEVYLSRNSYPYDDVKDLCLYCLKSFVLFCFDGDFEAMSQTLHKLDSGVPVHLIAEEDSLTARAIEGVNAFQSLLDLMDQAMQSEEYRGKQNQDLIDELFDDESDSEDSDSDEEEDARSKPDSLMESADSENIMSLLSQSSSSPPIVHIHKHISFMVQEEVKQAIPQFYAAGAEETFLALRKQKEEEWKSHSEEEQNHLKEVLDNLQNDIKSQQEMAALLREDLEEVHKIE